MQAPAQRIGAGLGRDALRSGEDRTELPDMTRRQDPCPRIGPAGLLEGVSDLELELERDKSQGRTVAL